VGRVVNAPAHSLELTLAEGHSRRAPEAEEIELRSPRGHNTRGYMAWTWLHTRKALPTWLHTRKVRPGRARWQEDVRGSSEAPHRPRLRHRRRRLHKANGYSSEFDVSGIRGRLLPPRARPSSTSTSSCVSGARLPSPARRRSFRPRSSRFCPAATRRRRPKRDTSVKRCGASKTPRVPTSPLCRGDQAPPNRVKTALANIAGRARDAREHLKGENIRESECVCVYVCVMWVDMCESVTRARLGNRGGYPVRGGGEKNK
jgi:hypothetical protein